MAMLTILAMLYGRVSKNVMPSAIRQSNSREAVFERLLADAFRKAAWRVTVQHRDHDQMFDLSVANQKHRYAIEFKAASEGRGDRLIPLLAQAILEAQAKARSLNKSMSPLAMVGAPRISESVAEEAESFASQYAPDIAIGLIDLEGFRAFKGPGLESLNAMRVFVPRQLAVPVQGSPAHLFSDLNQWMLKVLLAPWLPERFLSAPRKEYRNASQLAEAAQVSVMSAFRFVRQLEVEGFLDGSGGALKLVRVPELMRRWQAASLRPVRELAMRFIIQGNDNQFSQCLHSYVSKSQPTASHSRPSKRPLPRVCLGLFAAADALGIGFVHGVAPYVYLERPSNNMIRQLGLQISDNSGPADVYVRIPGAREAIFRAAVERDGLPVCDILQVWLDVSSHPARGSAQAEEIRRRLLSPLFEAQK
jgi:hypothetical protein